VVEGFVLDDFVEGIAVGIHRDDGGEIDDV